MDSQTPGRNEGALTGRGQRLFWEAEALLDAGGLGPVPSTLWDSPLEDQGEGRVRSLPCPLQT